MLGTAYEPEERGKGPMRKTGGLLGIVMVFLMSAGCPDGEEPSVVLLAPPDAACAGLTVAFQWHIDNRQAGVTYCAELLTDKGVNPFDGGVEDRFQAGQMTQLEVLLSPTRYDPARFEWGVRVTACEDARAACPCPGRSFESEIRRLRTSSQAPNCP